ncbi:hypothetical protein MOD96_02095 [Bacillus sp. S17B2]|uniref:hypothetical protein n=1 Tax=Bacillus sp. S17B2 TaxID=2918907 RepID=UPI002280ADC7|nr:hypothetical protein [Bacillus sp. S17B2]
MRVQEIKINDIEEAVMDDRVLIMSASSQYLNGKEGKVEQIDVGKFGAELFVGLDDGGSTWIDADDVILIN